ncbi:MFS transporter [Olsenella uli]|uniref:MFS transporter n=1 Tax=Olsenella uli TaxID=133926 RepID=UPI0031F4A1AB
MIQSSLRGNGPRGAFLVSYGMGVVADQVFYVALSWYALVATDSDIATGAIVSLGALPRALLLLPGGMLADRLGHRVSSVISGLVRAAVLAVAAALCGASGPSVAALSAMAVAFGAIEALYLPGTQSIVADVAAPDELERTQGLFSAVQKAGTVLAPALAGWAVRVLEPRTLLWCVCLIALASSLTLAVGPRREEAVGGPVPQVSTRAALGGILRDPVIARCLALILVAEFAAAGITGTGYALLSAQKGWDAAQMGSVLSLYGAGAAVSALAVAAARPRRTSAWIGSSTAVCGVAFAVSGVFGLPAARFAALVAGLGVGVSSTLLLTTYLSRIRDGLVATALSVMSLAAFGTTSLSYVLFGAVSSSTTPSVAFAVFGCALAASGLAFWKSTATLGRGTHR